MLITIDTEFLVKNKISATQFIALYLIKEREVDLLVRFLTETDTLNIFIENIGKLAKQGFILDYRADMYDFKYLEVSEKFTNFYISVLFTKDQMKKVKEQINEELDRMFSVLKEWYYHEE